MRTLPTAKGLIVGIDASNIRGGGGRTHLIEMLDAADPERHGISKIVVWGSRETVGLLTEKPWLEKRSPKAIETSSLWRSWWSATSLSSECRRSNCDVLFVPGGSFAGTFRPFVTMSQNLLPFEWQELWRYGYSLTTLRLLLLRFSQSQSFQRADGVIFLTRYARDVVMRATGVLNGAVKIIPHGLGRRFMMKPRPQRPIQDYGPGRPFRILYVSIIDEYKHQWKAVAAIASLRLKFGWPVVLELVGPANPRSLERLNAAIQSFDFETALNLMEEAMPTKDLANDPGIVGK